MEVILKRVVKFSNDELAAVKKVSELASQISENILENELELCDFPTFQVNLDKIIKYIEAHPIAIK